MRNKLPPSWMEIPFMEILDIQGGTQPPKSDFIYEPRDGYIRLLQIRDFGKKPIPTYVPLSNTLKTCKEDDILIARYGASIGRIVTGMTGAYNVALAKVVVPKQFNRKYFLYLLKSDIFQKTILSTRRSAQDGFNKNDLQNIILPIPPILEQARIADKMDLIFKKLDTVRSKEINIPGILHYIKNYIINSAANGNLSADWRIINSDFEDATTLIKKVVELRKGDHEKLANILKLDKKASPRALKFNNEDFDNKDLYKLPKSWQWIKLLNIADIIGGVTKGKKGEENMIDVPYLRVANVQDGYLDLSDVKTIKVTNNDFVKYKLLKGDILMTEGGDRDKLGRGTVWNDEVEDCIHQNHIFRARVNQKFISSDYISLFTKSFVATNYFFQNANQTVNLASISLKTLSTVPIALPPIEEQLEIVTRVNQYFSLLSGIENKRETLKNYLHSIEKRVFKMAFQGTLVPNDNTSIDTDTINQIIKERDNLKNKFQRNINNTVNKQLTMKTKTVTNYSEFIKCLTDLGGQATPEELLISSKLEDDIDFFFELLRAGRNDKSIEVPSGTAGLIKMIVS